MSKLKGWISKTYGWRTLTVTDREVTVEARYQPAMNTIAIQPRPEELEDPTVSGRLLEKLNVQLKVSDEWVAVTAEEANSVLPVSLVAALLQAITEAEQVNPSRSDN